MNFDWKQYVILARELERLQQTLATEEARLRSAISRAYYGAFCAARNKLVHEGHTNIRSEPNCHWYVWDQFESSPQLERQQIGLWGKRLRKARNEADYEDTMGSLPFRTSKALWESEHVFDQLAKLP